MLPTARAFIYTQLKAIPYHTRYGIGNDFWLVNVPLSSQSSYELNAACRWTEETNNTSLWRNSLVIKLIYVSFVLPKCSGQLSLLW